MIRDLLQKLTKLVESYLAIEGFGSLDLAREAGMNQSNLKRRLKYIFNHTISQFIREIRLKKAKELLQRKDLTVEEISNWVGFGRQPYFNKCFHEYFVMPPGSRETEKRKANRKISVLKPIQQKSAESMKKKVTTLILLLVITELNGQFSERNAIYATGELNIGNYVGVNLNLNYVFKEKYSFQIGYSGYTRESKSQPEDYTSGITVVFTLGFSEFHFDNMENYQFLAGKIYSLNESGTIRLNMSGGIGYTIITEPTNWQRISGFTLGENYTYDIDKHKTISLIINPKVEFPFTRFFGLIISPMLQINKDRTFIGIGIGLMIGLLRE